MKLTHTLTAVGLALGLVASNAMAANSIYIDNQTEMTYKSQVNSQFPGSDFVAGDKKAVNLFVLRVGCNRGGNYANCPVEFFNKDTSEKVAEVNFNMHDMSLNQAPEYFNGYEEKMSVTGWEEKPITTITLTAK